MKSKEIVLSVSFSLFCLVAPWSIAGMQISLFLTVILSIIFSVMEKKSPVKFHSFFFFPAIYLLMVLISVILSPDSYSSLVSVMDNEWYLLILPFIVSLPLTAEWRKRAFYILIFSATLAGIYGIFQFFDGVEYFRHKALAQQGQFFRAVGGYSFYLTFAGNQLFVFAVAWAFFLQTKKWKINKTILLIFSVILFLSILATFGRSAWLGAGLIVMLGTYLTNKRLFIYTAMILILAFIIIFFLFPDIQLRFTSIFDPAQNESRLTIWGTSWNMFVHHPFFGIGPGFFNEYFHIYKVPGMYDVTGHAHNDYLNVAALSGIFGLLSWIGMWIAFFYYSLKAFKQAHWQDGDRQIILASILGLAGILFASVFQCYYTDLENNLYWWFLLSSTLMIITQSDKREKNSV